MTTIPTLAALFAGLVMPLTLSTLPPLWMVGTAVLLGLALLAIRRVRLLAVWLLGACWACWSHQLVLDQRLHHELDNQRVSVVGKVVGMPEQTALGWRFLLDEARDTHTSRPLPLIRAHWYGGERVEPGETWRFEMRIRRPRGMSNPGAFDYEAWLFAQEIGALGSIRSGKRLEAAISSPSQWRLAVRQRLDAVLRDKPGASRLIALVVGDRSVLSRGDWDTLQATGTGHLMVISGLHVGMVAAAVFAGVYALGWLGLLRVSWPYLWLAAPVSLLIAGGYAALAGFAVPTQRALLMVALVFLARLRYRQINPWVFWLAALCAVVIVAPGAPLRAGFWLSFVAVGLLIVGMAGRLANRSWWWRWGRAQWVIFIGLWPWLVLWGMPGSLSAPLVNVAAIPWVSLLVVPAALLGTVLELAFGASWLLDLAATALDWLFRLLTHAAGWQSPVALGFPGWFSWVIAVAGALLLISPLVSLVRIPALICLLALAYPDHRRPESGAFWVTVLDVGQGLSVLVQTQTHTLLYDAGARLSSGFDLGEAVVSPALLDLGVRRLDTLLLSHADNDHAGGAGAVLKRFSVSQVLSGQARELAKFGAAPCVAGQAWRWDEVEFQIVYSAPPPAPSNERSCVLRVANAHSAVVLPGDVGIRGEYQMLGENLQADLLLAPHHGSRTSSSYPFIRAVQPRWVAFSAGHHSRFNHPHEKVVERYRELHVEPVYTARSGAMKFDFPDHQPGTLSWNWRDRSKRFWHE